MLLSYSSITESKAILEYSRDFFKDYDYSELRFNSILNESSHLKGFKSYDGVVIGNTLSLGKLG